MRAMRKAGVLYAVVPPSTKTKDSDGSPAFHSITSGGKNTGAAVLARTIFHWGMHRLQSGRSGPLYFAQGLLLIGHAESVVALRVTTTSRLLRNSGFRLSGSLKDSLSFFSSAPLS